MRTRYDLCDNASIINDDGTVYPDILTAPFERFRYSEVPFDYTLRSVDLTRPDILVNSVYDVAEFDDLLFILNGILTVFDDVIGTDIKIPSSTDMENFYRRFRK